MGDSDFFPSIIAILKLLTNNPLKIQSNSISELLNLGKIEKIDYLTAIDNHWLTPVVIRIIFDKFNIIKGHDGKG